MNYQPFPVAGAKTGLSTYLKPWLRTEDALSDIQDCYVNRSSIQKRFGFALYDNFPNRVGIFYLPTPNGTATVFNGTLPYTIVARKSLTISHTSGGVVITDGVDDGAGNISGTNITAGTINYATGAISITFTVAPDKNTAIQVNFGQIYDLGDGATKTFTGAFWVKNLPVMERSVIIGNTFTAQISSPSGDTPDSGGTFGTISVNPSGSITYSSGVSSVTFVTAPPAAAANREIFIKYQYKAPASPIKGIEQYITKTSVSQTVVFNNHQAAYIDADNYTMVNITGSDIYNAGVANFFWTANWQSKLWILNNADRLSFYDGTSIQFPVVAFDNASPLVNNLTTGLAVFVFRNRLIILRPVVDNVVQPQAAIYSSLNNPFDWVQNVQGHGGRIDAPTGEWIISAEFLRDELIVQFQESTWKLRYTGNDNDPFRWQKINDTRRVDAPYGSVPYQDYVTAVGSTGLVKSDGVSLNRYDNEIIDYVSSNFDLANINLVNGFRFNEFYMQFLCYPSIDPVATDYCDKWLVWNWFENTFCTWNILATTFGYYKQGNDLAWEDFTAANGKDWSWSDINIENSTWLSFYSQSQAIIPLFGTDTGEIFQILPFFATDNGRTTGFTFTTKDFNPFVKEGKQCRLGYVDFYFDSAEGDGAFDPNYTLSVDLFLNESVTPYKTVILNPSDNDWIAKRVYVGAIGNFHHFTVYLSQDQITNSTVATKGFVLNGWIWYACGAGRIIR